MKLQYNEPLSNFAFNFNLRRYTLDPSKAPAPELASAPASALTERTNHGGGVTSGGGGDGDAHAGEQEEEEGNGGEWEQNVCRTTKIRRMRRVARKQQQEEVGTDG